MTRDANQIAQEYARNHVFDAPGGGPATNTTNAPAPRRGQFTVLSNFQDTATVIATHLDVSVEVTVAGFVVLTYKDGAKTMFKPVEGWAMLFEPHNAGE